jgi:hypothetical protein
VDEPVDESYAQSTHRLGLWLWELDGCNEILRIQAKLSFDHRYAQYSQAL